jgi:hypothetical protein
VRAESKDENDYHYDDDGDNDGDADIARGHVAPPKGWNTDRAGCPDLTGFG